MDNLLQQLSFSTCNTFCKLCLWWLTHSLDVPLICPKLGALVLGLHVLGVSAGTGDTPGSLCMDVTWDPQLGVSMGVWIKWPLGTNELRSELQQSSSVLVLKLCQVPHA